MVDFVVEKRKNGRTLDGKFAIGREQDKKKKDCLK
jgi:hypothetical protein